MLEKHHEELSKYYSWHLVGEYTLNPLFEATEIVEADLEMTPDRRTNKNQVEPLEAVSPYIFYELKRTVNPMTPTKVKRASSVNACVTAKKKTKRSLLGLHLEAAAIQASS